MIYSSIYELHKKYNISVHRTTKLLGISESAYYNWVRSGRILENNSIKLMHAIIKEYAKSHGIYGAGKITSILNFKFSFIILKHSVMPGNNTFIK